MVKYVRRGARIFYSSPNIIRVIIARRLRWSGHVTCMGQQKYIQSLAENLNKRVPPHGATAPSGPGPPHHTALHDHTHLDITHLVGVLWAGDQPDSDTSTRQNKTFTRQTSMLPAGFEPAIQQASSRRPTP